MNVDGYFLTRADQAKLVELLATIPDVCEDLLVTLTKQDRLTAGSLKVSNGSDEQPLPISEGAMEASDLLQNTLAGWVRHVCEERVMTYEGRGDTISLSRWLSRWHVALAMSEGAGESLGEIRYAVSVARRAVDRPREKVREVDEIEVHEAGATLVSATEAQRLAPSLGYPMVTMRRVLRLKESGKLTPVVNVHGTDMYRIADIIAAHLAHPSRQRRIAS